MSRAELDRLGWTDVDVLLVTGDAYVDHPAFGAALIGRVLVAHGFRVGIAAQPDWKDPNSVLAVGRPRLFAGVTAGAMDSLVANYTANKKLRRDDAYSPHGRHGLRPNRASLVYTSLVRHAFPGLPVVLGGIEASMRRLAHYDYWEDRVRRSLLVDAKADLLVYGMGERAVVEIAQRLRTGGELKGIPGTAGTLSAPPSGPGVRVLPDFEAVSSDPALFLHATLSAETAQFGPAPRVLAQAHGTRWVVVNPPQPPLTPAELDALYALPFARRAHPSTPGPVPALAPVANSVVTHRGCFGGCTFCALGLHQGKTIQSRSVRGVLNEVRRLSSHPDFHGTVTDLGGPTANMFGLGCGRTAGECARPSCLYPARCRYLNVDHGAQIDLLKRVKTVPGVKHAFVASGLRYDLCLEDPRYLRALIAGGHVSGTLKVAPEHVDPGVLRLMRKPGLEVFTRFLEAYRRECRAAGRSAHLTAYTISGFPGSDRRAMARISAYAAEHHLRVEQMQDFIPLPMTVAGAMYHAGLDPWTRRPLAVPKSPSERRAQRHALLKR